MPLPARRASLLLALLLAACAAPSGSRPDYAARNRPLEERCARLQPGHSPSKPGMTREEVQAAARDAARRGELDKACDWL